MLGSPFPLSASRDQWKVATGLMTSVAHSHNVWLPFNRYPSVSPLLFFQTPVSHVARHRNHLCIVWKKTVLQI